MLNLSFFSGNKSEAPKQDNFKVGQIIRNTNDNNLILVTGIEDGIITFVEQDAGSEYNPTPKRNPNAEEKRVNISEWKEFLQKTGYMN